MCKLYHQAEALPQAGVHVISIDEETGVQALERLHPTRPMAAGQPEAVEFEYVRHGTQTLIANVDVATGQVIVPTVGDTRTEEDFAAHLCQTAATDPQGEWIFIADSLNTYKSAGLVQVVAELCGIQEDLGKKGQAGVLHSMATRAAFLQDSAHRIRLI